MSETTKSERIAWRKEAKDPKTEFTHEERHGILNLVDDADRLAAIERDVGLLEEDLRKKVILKPGNDGECAFAWIEVADKLRAILDSPDDGKGE